MLLLTPSPADPAAWSWSWSINYSFLTKACASATISSKLVSIHYALIKNDHLSEQNPFLHTSCEACDAGVLLELRYGLGPAGEAVYVVGDAVVVSEGKLRCALGAG